MFGLAGGTLMGQRDAADISRSSVSVQEICWGASGGTNAIDQGFNRNGLQQRFNDSFLRPMEAKTSKNDTVRNLWLQSSTACVVISDGSPPPTAWATIKRRASTRIFGSCNPNQQAPATDAKPPIATVV